MTRRIFNNLKFIFSRTFQTASTADTLRLKQNGCPGTRFSRPRVSHAGSRGPLEFSPKAFFLAAGHFALVSICGSFSNAVAISRGH